MPAPGRPDLATFAADGALLVASDDGTITDGARVIGKHAASNATLEPVAPHAVLAASRDGSIALWDRATGAALARLHGSHAAASRGAIATGDPTGRVALADRTLGTLAHPIAAIRWSPDGSHLGAIDESGAARIWDRGGMQVLDLPAADTAVAGGPEQTVVDEVLEALGRPQSPLDLAFSPDGRWVARACPGCATLHEVATGRTRVLANGPAPGEPVLAVAFAHDGSRVLLAYGGTVRLWDTTTGAVTATIAANTRTLAAAFSPDDRLVFTGGMDSRLRVWDAASGAEYTGFDLNSPIHQIAVAGDGAQIAAISANTVMRWTLAPLTRSAAVLRALATSRE